ncbi:uncharacterized protein LOC123665860 [Melitaea cinxia]|uniref:uncharacterized protein LOC123665860 n=1 Tax=Melitaea cinxia TaxID=113334 RepID=UPI001E270CE6|nr:uncharacterized protein LOC123665860 [Melitaea cinxia]
MNCIRLFKPNTFRSLYNITSVKCISQHPLKFLESQGKWQEKDGLTKNWQLIYKAPMGNILNYAVTYLTSSTAIIGAAAIYYTAFKFDMTTINDPIVLGDQVVIANNTTEYLIYLGAFIIFHVALKVLLSKFVIRLYKNGDEYLAIFRGSWYNSIVKHKFHLEEFKKLNPTFVVSWGDSRFGLGKKHGILLDKYFRTPEHFNYLLNKKKSA